MLLSELQFSNALKTLFEMRLHSKRVFCLRQDLQKFIIGQKKETDIRGAGRGLLCCTQSEVDLPRKIQPLLLQVVVETFLDLLQQLVGFLQAAQHIVLAGDH